MCILDFSKAFQTNQKFYCQFEKKVKYLYPFYLGDLTVISGNILACDPLVFPETISYLHNIPSNEYPVILSLASDSPGVSPKIYSCCKTVCFAMICFTEKKAVTWEIIADYNDHIKNSEENQYFGYEVDSGIGCFMDTYAAQAIVDSLWNSDTYEETISYQLNELLTMNNQEFAFANLLVNSENNLNIIAFSSGFGDGVYPSYLGYDNKENLVKMITQFVFGNFL